MVATRAQGKHLDDSILKTPPIPIERSSRKANHAEPNETKKKILFDESPALPAKSPKSPKKTPEPDSPVQGYVYKKTFATFYPFYLQEHSNGINRFLHFVGTFIVLLIALAAVSNKEYRLLMYCPLAGYGFAWIGHFIFQKNRPATFKQPIFSLFGDFVMFWHLLTGQLSFDSSLDPQA
jgi:hypothetical protein